MSNESNAPDLTPAEARAEVEAFMGEGWNVTISSESPAVFVHAFLPQPGPFACVDGHGPTYRAAVDALKQAWRDAVRPWVRKADEQAFSEALASTPAADLAAYRKIVLEEVRGIVRAEFAACWHANAIGGAGACDRILKEIARAIASHAQEVKK